MLKFNKTSEDVETFNEHVQNVLDTIEAVPNSPNSKCYNQPESLRILSLSPVMVKSLSL